MKFIWFVAVLFALLAAMVSGQQCPTNFKPQQNKCVADRPIHGTCPAKSEYDANINKCVYGKKI